MGPPPGVAPNLHFPHLHQTQIYTNPDLHQTQIYTNPDLHKPIFGHIFQKTQIYTKPKFTQPKFTQPKFTQNPNLHNPNLHKTKKEHNFALQIYTKLNPNLHGPKFTLQKG